MVRPEAGADMKERPIIFSAESVGAILAGRKTQTRRVIKSQPHGLLCVDCASPYGYSWDSPSEGEQIPRCPYGQVGDRLWVRETFVLENTSEYSSDVDAPTDRPFKQEGDEWEGHYLLIPHYRATEPEPNIVSFDREDGLDDHTSWKSSIFMPRWASRITLEIVRVGVERVQLITESEAKAEGVEFQFPGKSEATYRDYQLRTLNGCETAKESYMTLWDSINRKRGYGWQENPWVWVVEFRRMA